MVARRDQMSVEDFLALDRESLDQKYEFRNGHMVAMAGGSTNHTVLITNIASLLHLQLRKSPCTVLTEGTLRIEDECYIPDVMVTCDEADLTENKTYIEHPKIVIEVLSPTTETDDRRNKLWAYTQCDSIQEYILVNWDVMMIQRITRKGTEGLDRIQWIDRWYTQNEEVELETLGFTIAVDNVYEKVTLPSLDPLRGFRKRARE